MTPALSRVVAPGVPPRYANAAGEATWDIQGGNVCVDLAGDQESDLPEPLVRVDVELEYEYGDGMPVAAARVFAAAIVAACDAVDGRPLNWIQYRAVAPPVGEPDPDHPGMVKVGPGHWEGPSRLSEMFDLDIVGAFWDAKRREGCDVTVERRTFWTLTDITDWEVIPDFGQYRAAAVVEAPQELRSRGAELIAAERLRQIEVEGYTTEYDLAHARSGRRVFGGELTMAAAAYMFLSPGEWPWGAASFKPAVDGVRNLVKAGALISAAIDAETVRAARADVPDAESDKR